jgi:hypothetical protein
MAIEPYLQRTRLLDAREGASTQLVSPYGLDSRNHSRNVSEMLFGLSETFLRTAEPYLRKKAIDQGLADFAADGLGKDEEGNPILPKAEKGGVLYREAYDNAAKNQFIRESAHALELKLANFYSDPENAGMTPEEMFESAQAIVKGHILGVPAELQGPMFEIGTRELRQFHLGRSTQFLNKTLADFDRQSSNDLKRLMEKHETLQILGPDNDAVIAQSATLLKEMEQIIRDRISMGFGNEKDIDQLRSILEGNVRVGTVVFQFRQEQDSMSSLEIQDLVNMLRGSAPPGTVAMGYTQEKLFEVLQTAEERARVEQIVAPVVAQKQAKETEIERLQDIDYDFENWSWGTWGNADTPEKQAKLALEFAKRQGFDPFSPNALQIFQNAFGGLPTLLYKKAFEGLSTWSSEKLQASENLIGALKNLPGKDGIAMDRMSEFLDAADAGFLEAYLAQREAGLPADMARLAAREVYDKGIAMDGPAQRELLRQRFKAVDDSALDAIFAKAIETPWGALTDRAREWVLDYASTLVAMDINPNAALERAAAAFKGNWVQNPYDVSMALVLEKRGVFDIIDFRDTRYGGWVPKREAIPTSIVGERWVEAVVEHALKTRLAPQQNIVLQSEKPEELKFGVNVRTRFVGETPNGSRLFNLMYHDRDKSGLIVPLLDKDGGTIIVDLGKAQKSYDTQVQSFRVARAQSERALAQLQKKLIGGQAGGGRNPEARKAYQQALEEHKKRFPPENLLLASITTGWGKPWKHPGVKITEEDYAPPAIMRQLKEQERMMRNAPSGVDRQAVNDVSRSAIMTLRRLNIDRMDSIAIVAALQGESGVMLQPDAIGDKTVNGKPVDASQWAKGIAQWRLDRLQAFLQRHGKPMEQATREEQLDFINYELRTKYRAAWRAMQQANTIEEKMSAFIRYYLRPKDPEGAYRKRLPYARALAQEFMK